VPSNIQEEENHKRMEVSNISVMEPSGAGVVVGDNQPPQDLSLIASVVPILLSSPSFVDLPSFGRLMQTCRGMSSSGWVPPTFWRCKCWELIASKQVLLPPKQAGQTAAAEAAAVHGTNAVEEGESAASFAAAPWRRGGDSTDYYCYHDDDDEAVNNHEEAAARRLVRRYFNMRAAAGTAVHQQYFDWSNPPLQDGMDYDFLVQIEADAGKVKYAHLDLAAQGRIVGLWGRYFRLELNVSIPLWPSFEDSLREMEINVVYFEELPDLRISIVACQRGRGGHHRGSCTELGSDRDIIMPIGVVHLQLGTSFWTPPTITAFGGNFGFHSGDIEVCTRENEYVVVIANQRFCLFMDDAESTRSSPSVETSQDAMATTSDGIATGGERFFSKVVFLHRIADFDFNADDNDGRREPR
jgi:hypothetical protein